MIFLGYAKYGVEKVSGRTIGRTAGGHRMAFGTCAFVRTNRQGVHNGKPLGEKKNISRCYPFYQYFVIILHR